MNAVQETQDILKNIDNGALAVRYLLKNKHWKEVDPGVYVDGQTGEKFLKIGETNDQATANLLRKSNRIAGVQVNGK
jgi:hypothetical protein